ncbi:nucleotidyltransferase family protein [Dyadobacter sp. CY312]|uniref:nucleotidyltransferase domain-containing protein n=1 Tax=Dyadobacter sp. CY312 TaxID=2907303 RepID=UPI001F431AD0|nr:nucleotidyltransferase family protein [Dyadobacter sp. CY312]MCE7039818.1 nucleotidyltransferase family protein [Dyadobacter sp. CY312]
MPVNKKYLSPEMKMMLSACFQSNAEASDIGIDDKYLRNLIRYHGIRPQFLDFLHKSKLQTGFQDALVKECQQTAIINLLSVKELGKLSDLLRANGVVCFAYKGSVWADWLYGNVGKREFGDIDLLIERKSLDTALKVMAEQGYHPDAYRNYLLQTPDRTESFFRTDYHVPLENTSVATSSMVEAHWQVAYPRLKFDFPEEEWAQFQSDYQLHGNTVNAFQNEYQFLLLLVHHGGKEQWSRIKYIADFAAYMIRHGSQTDWKLVERLAREKGIYTLLTKSLDLLKSLGIEWNSKWPESKDVVDINPYLKLWLAMPPQAENSTWPYFVHGLTVHDGLKHKSKVLFGHLAYFLEWRLLYDKMRWYSNNPS